MGLVRSQISVALSATADETDHSRCVARRGRHPGLMPKPRNRKGKAAGSRGPRGLAGRRGRAGVRGPAGPSGERGPAGGLSQNHLNRLLDLRQEIRDAVRDAEPVKQLQQQVQDALKDGDRISELSRQVEGVQKELSIQFQRIAQIQAQLDKLMSILTRP